MSEASRRKGKKNMLAGLKMGLILGIVGNMFATSVVMFGVSRLSGIGEVIWYGICALISGLAMIYLITLLNSRIEELSTAPNLS